MKAALLAFLLIVPVRDLGQWENVPPEQRAWAQAQLIPGGPDKGKSCCSEADGVDVIENSRRNDGRYWVTFMAGGSLVGPMPVPPELVLQRSHYGPKVWWYNYGGQIMIRCYAPAPGI